MSQLTISQETFKKIKHSTSETLSLSKSNDNERNHNHYTLYKPSKCLKMPRKLLLNSLRLQINCSLKKKNEQKFILTRLRLFDHKFCLDQLHYMYQNYYEQGSQYQVWLVSVVNLYSISMYMIIHLLSFKE